jgi:hypothetical protein
VAEEARGSPSPFDKVDTGEAETAAGGAFGSDPAVQQYALGVLSLLGIDTPRNVTAAAQFFRWEPPPLLQFKRSKS